MIKIGKLIAAAALFAASSPAHADWHEARSKHFIIYSDERPEQLRAFAEKLERFDQAVRFIRGMNDPELTDAGRIRIFVLPRDEDIEKLARNRWIRGLYRTQASGSFAFVPRRSGNTMLQGASGGIRTMRSSLTSQAIFFHEYAHHLQLQDWTGVMPAWAREGFAEFFATAEVSDSGDVTIGKFPSYRSWEVFVSNSLSVERMLGETANLDGKEFASLYGRGWLLTHYLTVSSARKGQLNRYLEGIVSGLDPAAAAKAAFGDLQALEKELDAYSAPREFLAMTVDSRAIPIAPVTVRQLGPGEAAMIDVHMQSKFGVNDETAPGVAADARRIASRFPDDAFVQASLAEAEFDGSDYVAADAAADRALAADPRHVQALIYKGRAQLMLAKANPANADWDGVRSWFLKANKLDTENPEPLMHFYRTYLEAGERPTRNAVEALLYAIDLAPQDDSLRLLGVRQLAAEKRLGEAQSLFAPLAFNPHVEEESREKARAAMESLAAGDGDNAVTMLEDVQRSSDEQENDAKIVGLERASSR